MRVIYRKIHHARYLYIKRNVEKVWGARYTLGARYLSKNTVFKYSSMDKPVFKTVRIIVGRNSRQSHDILLRSNAMPLAPVLTNSVFE